MSNAVIPHASGITAIARNFSSLYDRTIICVTRQDILLL